MKLNKYYLHVLENQPDIVLEVERPPSVNDIYERAGKHTRRTKRYKRWIHDMMYLVHYSAKKAYSGRCAVVYTLARHPADKTMDVANFEKAMSDFLERAGIIANDRQIQHNCQQWDDEMGTIVCVEIFFLDKGI